MSSLSSGISVLDVKILVVASVPAIGFVVSIFLLFTSGAVLISVEISVFLSMTLVAALIIASEAMFISFVSVGAIMVWVAVMFWLFVTDDFFWVVDTIFCFFVSVVLVSVYGSISGRLLSGLVCRVVSEIVVAAIVVFIVSTDRKSVV